MEDVIQRIPPCPITRDDITLEFVTPSKAREYLALQVPNRNIKDRSINKMCYDVSAGNWIFNGDTVRFNKQGRMIDGQHRMKTIIKSDIGQWCIIVRNLPEKARDTIDVGDARTKGDVFNLNAITDGSLKASIVNMTRSLVVNKVLNAQNGKTPQSYTNAKFDLSPIATKDLYLQSSELFDSAARICAHYYKKKRLLGKAYIGAMYVFLIKYRNHKEEIVTHFLDELFISRDAEMNVINLLRDKLEENMMRKASNIKYDAKYIHALIIKTWNCYITKRDLKILTYSEKKEGVLYFV